MIRGFWMGLVVIAACVGLAGNLLAFSVGEIDLQSAANEPFRAEVPFVLEPHERDRELEVLLGTPQDYQFEELERPSILQHMHIIVAPDKQDTVRIFSNVPIPDEPFDLLMLLRSGQLTIVRNYYIDLPEAAQQVAVVEPVIRPAAADPVPSLQTTVPSSSPAAAPEPAISPTLPPVEAQANPPGLYGPVQRGETMYSVVGKLDVPADQRWQAVVLLWRLNHGAFLRGNLHGLLVGAYLEMPADFAARLSVMKREASQQIISGQWEDWRRRQVTTAAQALAMTMEAGAQEPEPEPEPYEEVVTVPVQPPAVMPQVAETLPPPEEPAPDDSIATVTPTEFPLETEVAAPVSPPEESAPDDSIIAAAPQEVETPPLPEEPVADDSTAAIAPPQVVRLPTDEGSSFVSTQELKLLLGNLEDRLLRRLAPVQESQGPTPFVSPAELQVSMQDLENRLTRRVEQMLDRGGPPLTPEANAQPSPALIPPSGFEFVAGVPMPPVAYLLILINVVLLVFALTLGWRWWRQNARGEA